MPTYGQRIAAAEELWDTVPDGQAIAERKLRAAQARILALEVELAGVREELKCAREQVDFFWTNAKLRAAHLLAKKQVPA